MPELHWLGDTDAKRAARRVPYRMLESVEQVGDASAQNLLIQGDNLEALKALLPFYAGRVKCIFIDPPYNTKSAFEHYDDNLEHSQWLSMMYPRLELLRDLLSEDGSIWVTIDDNEAHYLKVVMDEVFGRKNFVTSFIWQKVDSPNDNKVPITPDHEYMLCYEKKKDTTKFRKLSDASLLEAYGGRDEAGRSYRDRLLKKNGKNSLRSDRPTMFYPLDAPDGSIVYPIHDDGREARWDHSLRGVEAARAENRLIWKQRDRNGATVWVPYIREFAPAEPARPHPTILLDVKTSRQAKAHQRELLPTTEPFDTVKPEQLLQRVLEICTSVGDIVLDSYLGSGTTATVAQKMGRRYIGIEMGEHAVTHCLPRLKKVIDGEQGGISEAVGWKGGGGFRFMKLGEPVFLDDGRINPAVRFATLASYLWFLDSGAPHATNTFDTPLLGIMGGEQNEDGTSSPRTAIILLYNGILGDKRPQAGNVLTTPIWNGILAQLPAHDGPRIIYGEACRLSAQRLKQLGVTFKQIPYDIRMR